MLPDFKKLSSGKCRDSGLALVLICLICFQIWGQPIFSLSAIIFLLIAMTYPPLFKPFTFAWFALSGVMGSVVSRIILTLLFFFLVLPVGLSRRLIGKDPMQLRNWKKGEESVFRVSAHKFIKKDLETPY